MCQKSILLLWIKKFTWVCINILSLASIALGQSASAPSKPPPETASADTAPNSENPQNLGPRILTQPEISRQVMELSEQRGAFAAQRALELNKIKTNETISNQVSTLAQEDLAKKGVEHQKEVLTAAKAQAIQDLDKINKKDRAETQTHYSRYINNLDKNLPQKGHPKDYLSYNHSFKPIVRKQK